MGWHRTEDKPPDSIYAQNAVGVISLAAVLVDSITLCVNYSVELLACQRCDEPTGLEARQDRPLSEWERATKIT